MERIREFDRLEQEMLRRQLLDEAGIISQVGSGLLQPLAMAAGATALGYGAGLVAKRIADRTRAFRATIMRKLRLFKSSIYANTVKRFFNKFDISVEKLSGETCQALAKLWGGGISPEAIPEAVKQIKLHIWAVFNAQLATKALVNYLTLTSKGEDEKAGMARESLQAYKDGVSGMFEYDNNSFVNTGYGRTVFGLSDFVKNVSAGYTRLVSENNFGILFPAYISSAVFIANPLLAQSLTAAFRKETEEGLQAYYDQLQKEKQQTPEQPAEGEQPAAQTQQPVQGTKVATTTTNPQSPTSIPSQKWERRANQQFLQELAAQRFLESVEKFLRVEILREDGLAADTSPTTSAGIRGNRVTPATTSQAQAQAQTPVETPEDSEAEETDGTTPGTSPDEIEAAYKAWQEHPFAKHPVVIYNTKACQMYCQRPVDIVYLFGVSLMRRGLLSSEGIIPKEEAFTKFVANVSMGMLQKEFETAKADWAGQKYQAADDDKSNKHRRKGI